MVFDCLFFLWLQAMVREVCIPRLPRGNDGGGDRTYYLNSRIRNTKPDGLVLQDTEVIA